MVSSFADIKLVLMNNMVLGAGGQNTSNYVNKILASLGYVIAISGGFLLVIMGVKSMIAGLVPDQKDLKKIALGLVTIAAGGAAMIMGVAGFRSLAQNIGQDFTA